jgi:hypothetical protein
MLKEICKYIQSVDRNGNIMDAYEEYEFGEMDRDTLVMICQNILGDWLEDMQINGITKREQKYLDWLGV